MPHLGLKSLTSSLELTLSSPAYSRVRGDDIPSGVHGPLLTEGLGAGRRGGDGSDRDPGTVVKRQGEEGHRGCSSWNPVPVIRAPSSLLSFMVLAEANLVGGINELDPLVRDGQDDGGDLLHVLGGFLQETVVWCEGPSCPPSHCGGVDLVLPSTAASTSQSPRLGPPTRILAQASCVDSVPRSSLMSMEPRYCGCQQRPGEGSWAPS